MSNNSIDSGATMVPDNPDVLVQLTESTNDALWMFTPDWQDLVFVNSAYEDIFGHPVSVLKENPTAFLNAVHPEDKQAVRGEMERLSTGESVDLEFRVGPETDYQTWVWVQGEPIYDESGEIAYLAGYTRDITKRKEYQRKLEQNQEELKRSNESLREFAYIASHDLQEPLRMVSSYVDLLQQEYGDELDEEASEYMEFAIDGALRMKRMIDSLLEYSRVHTNASEFAQIDVDRVFEATLQDLELLLNERDVTLSVDELPTIKADRDQIGQVFQNLLKNAIEHGSEDGTPVIEVTATERADAYEFAVSDNGPGISSGHHEDIFQIFEKGAATSKTDNTGIGLAITKRIVLRHGGDIWVESEQGDGATFRFTIPKVASESKLGADANGD